VVCAGSPREMGFAQGVSVRSKILAARQALAQLEAFRMQQPWWLPYTAFRRLTEWKMARLLPALALDYPDLKLRLTGIAEGSRVSLPSLLLLNAVESAMSAVRGRFIQPSPGACSAVAVRAGRSLSGEPCIVQNFDYLPLVQPYYILRDSRP